MWLRKQISVQLVHEHTQTYSACTTSPSCCQVDLQSEASTGLQLGSNVSFDWALYLHRTFLLRLQLAFKIDCNLVKNMCKAVRLYVKINVRCSFVWSCWSVRQTWCSFIYLIKTLPAHSVFHCCLVFFLHRACEFVATLEARSRKKNISPCNYFNAFPHGVLMVKHLHVFQTAVVQLSDEMEFSRRTALSSGYDRRKTESVNDLEIRQEERLQKVIDMHSHRTDARYVWRRMWWCISSCSTLWLALKM